MEAQTHWSPTNNIRLCSLLLEESGLWGEDNQGWCPRAAAEGRKSKKT